MMFYSIELFSLVFYFVLLFLCLSAHHSPMRSWRFNNMTQFCQMTSEHHQLMMRSYHRMWASFLINRKRLWRQKIFIKTRPMRPTMRPHDDEMIVWWCYYTRYYLRSKSSIFPFLTKAWTADGRMGRRTDQQTHKPG